MRNNIFAHLVPYCNKPTLLSFYRLEYRNNRLKTHRFTIKALLDHVRVRL